MRSFLAVFLAALLMGGFAATAVAQSPTQDAYGGVLGEQVGDDDATSNDSPGGGQADEAGDEAVAPVAVANAQTGSSLPFTGLDLAVVVLIGAGLVGLGLGLRWASRRTPA
jgi:hypothetical protein